VHRVGDVATGAPPRGGRLRYPGGGDDGGQREPDERRAHGIDERSRAVAPGPRRRRHHEEVGALSQDETEKLAEAIRRLLVDPDARISQVARYRWEGALAALEAVLGGSTTLPVSDPERFRL